MSDEAWARAAVAWWLDALICGMAGQYDEWAQELRQGLRKC